MLLSKLLIFTSCMTFLGVSFILHHHCGCDDGSNYIPVQISLKPSTANSMYGQWKQGSSGLTQTCAFLNNTGHRSIKCCVEKQKLHFVFNNETLNHLDAIKEIWRILGKKSILFVGDSLMREFYFYARELLHFNKSSVTATFNASCEFILAHTIYIKESTPALDKPTSVTEKTLVKKIAQHDIIVFNQGLHYMKGPLEEIAIHFHYLGRFLHQQTHKTTKQVILRSTIPQHFVSRSGTGFYHERSPNNERCLRRVPNPTRNPTDHLLAAEAGKYGFEFLDNFPIYYQRGDLTNQQYYGELLDCTHHCYTSELIWPELVLLTQLIRA